MRLIVGAPIAERAWALPKWFACLRAQTVQPDGFVFIYSKSSDRTLQAIAANSFGRLYVGHAPESFIPREARNASRTIAFTELASHRNRLLEAALAADADVFLSLDTDVFLTEPTAIAQLVEALEYLPVSSLLTYLSPAGAPSECFNAAYWTSGDQGDPGRSAARVTGDQFRASVGVLAVDVPMAVVMMNRLVLENCRYAFHERGEDFGFAQDLDRRGIHTAWLTGLEAPHVMRPESLSEMVP